MNARDFLRRLFVPPEGRRLEYLARVLTAGLFLGLAVALLVGSVRPPGSSGHEIELVARQPAAGGWSRERIVVNQGERVRLRIRSEDVVHGFAIGRLGVEAGPIEPGKVTTVEFTADQAGEFTFYCTMWCDPNHPRMRGILEVRGASRTAPTEGGRAADVGIEHLDAPREAGAIPAVRPSAAQGRGPYEARCARCHGVGGEGTERGKALDPAGSLRDRSPADVFRMLNDAKDASGGDETASHGGALPGTGARVPPHAGYTRGWSAREQWDVVAYVWFLGTSSGRLDLGQRLYLRNCAACHGERGVGDGPGGKFQPKTPANFMDARRMLAGTSALYTAKIRRGGMGTGMPYWGSIFTEDEIAALVGYLWTFSLGTDK